MKLIVLMKQVPDTEEERRLQTSSALLDRNASQGVADEINERALELALSYKDANRGTEVVLLSMGPEPAQKSLRKGLQMGADSAIHVSDESLSGADSIHTARILAAALQDSEFDLIIAGNESTDGGGGVVPAMVSELLGVPMLGSLNTVVIQAGTVEGQRQEDYRTMRVRASMPALISVTERVAEPRFPNFRGILAAKRKPLIPRRVEELPAVGPERTTARSVVLAVRERPARAAGVKIIDQGDAGLKLAEFLVSNRLV